MRGEARGYMLLSTGQSPQRRVRREGRRGRGGGKFASIAGCCFSSIRLLPYCVRE